MSQAWAAARPLSAEAGIEVPPPRAASAAEAAGLRFGDVIVAVDGAKVDSHAVLQGALRNLEPRDRVRLQVRRDGKEFALLADAPRAPVQNVDGCLDPSGQEFAPQRAAEIRDRLQNGDAVARADRAAALGTLTARELQVLCMVAEGATNPRVADQLNISRATVARHVANILAEFGVSNRVEAASLAAANQLIAGR